MKRTIIIISLLISFGLSAGPFTTPNSGGAQIVMSENKSTEQLFPMQLVGVNGKNIPTRTNSVWMEPGEYELKFSAAVDRRLTKTRINKTRKGTQGSTLNIELEPNKIYYVAYDASSDNDAEWQPVVYSIESKTL